MTSEPLHDLASRLRHLAGPAAGVPDADLLRRFADARDEAAFELLVWRHGGMVLAACRRVLGRSADADDAFQATFLALIRNAGAVRRGDVLGGWLHRVAVRAALRLRGSATRYHPAPEPAAPPAPPPDDTAAVLDEEIARLPEKLRVAFVLCHLDGRTNEEAAARLGVPKGTVLSRLSRARERLRDRLTRRGVGVPAAGLAALAAPAPLTAGLVGGAARLAAGGTAPAPVLTLTHGVLRAMRLDHLKPLAALAAAVALAAGVVLTARPPSPAAPIPARPAPREVKLATADHGVVQVDSVRFSPDGKWVVTEGWKWCKGDEGEWLGNAVAVWDAATGKHAHTFPEDDTGCLDFSPGGKTLAIVGRSGRGAHAVILVEVGIWKELASFEFDTFASNVRFSPDGKLLTAVHGYEANGERHGGVRVWDVATGKLRFERVTRKKEVLTSAAFAPDGDTLAVGASGGVVYLIDTQTGKDLAAVRTPTARPVHVTFTPDGERLLTWQAIFGGGKWEKDYGLRAWDPTTGRELFAFEGYADPWPVIFSRDGKRVAGRGGDVRTNEMTCDVWDVTTGKRTATVKGADVPGRPGGFAFAPGDGHLAVLVVKYAEDGKGPGAPVGRLFTVPGGKEAARLPGVKGLAFDHARGGVALVTGADLVEDFNEVNGVRRKPGDPPDVVTVRDLAGLLNPAR